MRVLFLATILWGLLTVSHSFSCYGCDKNSEECDDDHPGKEIDCPEENGCNIMTNENNYIRRCGEQGNATGCTETLDPDHEDDGITRSCNCNVRECNKDWKTAGAEDKIQCYSCDTDTGACDEMNTESKTYCAVEAGCSISVDAAGVFVKGCSGELEPTPGCNNDDNSTTCFCMEKLCNVDWPTAGSTTGSSETTPNGPPIKCYSCDKNSEECDDDHHGTEIDCPIEKGCYITENENNYKRGCGQHVSPGCLVTIDPDHEDDGITRSCECFTERCNEDFKAAGAQDKIKCYSCDSHAGECDDAHPGSKDYCSVETGCSISLDVDGVFVRGCSGELEPTPGCNNDDNATTCFCMEELCNIDWSTAGSTTAGNSETTPKGDYVKCYSCDSNNGECDDDHHGSETDCPAEKGCNILSNGNIFTRGCSEVMEPGCNETFVNPHDGITRSCNCQTALCNENWKDAGGDDKIKCYGCSSDAEDCDETQHGNQIYCSLDAGCVISKDAAGVFVRSCSGEIEPTPGCNNEDNSTTCFCMENLCNADWTTAGSTTGSETTQEGPSMKCYTCDSVGGECSEEAKGTEKDCPKAKGCTIRRTGDVMVRDCSSEKDITCDTIPNGDDEPTQFCDCDTPLCNGDWSSAGSTEKPPPTEEPTPTPETTAPTDAPGAATSLSSALAIALGVIGSLVVVL